MINNQIILIGFGAGLLSGLLGVGGGIIMVPAMVLLLGMTQHEAHGTSLFVITGTALIGAIIYSINGSLEMDHVFFILLGSVTGALLGSNLADKLSERNLRLLYCIFLIFVGIKMITG